MSSRNARTTAGRPGGQTAGLTARGRAFVHIDELLAEGRSLRRFALACIVHGIETGRRPHTDLSAAPSDWREPAACFVTLEAEGELRGCCGTLDASLPLAESVAASAHRSAFEDPRFPPVSAPELQGLDVEVSVLGPLAPFRADSRSALLASLRPGIDGLLLREGYHQATFLPDVWRSLPEPGDFFDALLQKAGLPRGYWSRELRFERYETTKAD